MKLTFWPNFVLEKGQIIKDKSFSEFRKGKIVMVSQLSQRISKAAALVGYSRPVVNNMN